MLKALSYFFLIVGVLCIPFAAKQGLLAITIGDSHLRNTIILIVSAAILLTAGFILLRQFQPTSTSRRYHSSSRRIRL